MVFSGHKGVWCAPLESLIVSRSNEWPFGSSIVSRSSLLIMHLSKYDVNLKRILKLLLLIIKKIVKIVSLLMTLFLGDFIEYYFLFFETIFELELIYEQEMLLSTLASWVLSSDDIGQHTFSFSFLPISLFLFLVIGQHASLPAKDGSGVEWARATKSVAVHLG